MSARSAGCSSESFVARKAQLHAAQRVGLDKVDEFPEDGALGQFLLDAANAHRRNDALEQAADSAGQANVNLREAQLGVAVDARVGELDVVDADDFAAVGVDDLLVEQVFLHGEPGFVGMVELERGFVGGELEAAGNDRVDLVEARDKRAVFAAADEQARDAVGLLVGDDEHFLDAADEISEGIVGLGADDFGCVKHKGSFQSFAQETTKRAQQAAPLRRSSRHLQRRRASTTLRLALLAMRKPFVVRRGGLLRVAILVGLPKKNPGPAMQPGHGQTGNRRSV